MTPGGGLLHIRDACARPRTAPGPAPAREATRRRRHAGAVDAEEADRRRCPGRWRGELEHARGDELAARPREARVLYERVLHEMRSPEHQYLAACLMRWIARTHMTEGNLDAARDQLEGSLAAAAACDSHPGMARALNFLGAVEQSTGHVDAAADYYERALNRANDAGDRQLIAMVQQNMGALAADVQGRHDVALAYFRRALDGYRAMGLDSHAAAAWSNIGKAYTALGQFKRARRAHQRALYLSERAGDRPHALRARTNLAELHVKRGRFAEADRLCRQVLVATDAGAAHWLAEAHLYAGICAREAGRPSDAVAHLDAATRIAGQRLDPLLGAETAREYAALLARQGRNAEAFAKLRHAYAQFESVRAQQGLADIEERFARFERQFVRIVEGWSQSLELCDPYTRGHSDRVAQLATRLARTVGFDQRSLFWFHIGALLHDIGKLKLPIGVLTKPGPLTGWERTLVQKHPVDGVALLGTVDFPLDVRPMIRSHHERWDGTGYPDRLAGQQIPLAARILAIADVYDALTTSRSYRAAHTQQDALAIMQSERGRAFDPVLFDRFLELFVCPEAMAS